MGCKFPRLFAYEDVIIVRDNIEMRWLHARYLLGDSWRAELERLQFCGNEVVLLDERTIWVELQELLFRFNVRGSGALLFVLADQVGHRNLDREEGRSFTLVRGTVRCSRDIK